MLSTNLFNWISFGSVEELTQFSPDPPIPVQSFQHSVHCPHTSNISSAATLRFDLEHVKDRERETIKYDTGGFYVRKCNFIFPFSITEWLLVKIQFGIVTFAKLFHEFLQIVSVWNLCTRTVKPPLATCARVFVQIYVSPFKRRPLPRLVLHPLFSPRSRKL